MSIIVAVQKDDRIALAADTLHFYGSRREHPENLPGRSKIKKLGTSYIGGVGWMAYETIINHYFGSMKRAPSLTNEKAIFDTFLKLWKASREKYHVVNDQPDTDNDSPFADLDSSFVVVNKKGMFSVDADLTVVEFAQYVAIGSGNNYAYGSLHALYDSKYSADEIAVAAVGAAIHFDTHCGGEIECHWVK